MIPMTLLHYEPKTSQPAIRPELIAQLKYRAGKVADEDYSGDITNSSKASELCDSQPNAVQTADTPYNESINTRIQRRLLHSYGRSI